jgi:hypothetical protein
MKYLFALLSVTAVTLFGVNLNHVAEIAKPTEIKKVEAPTNIRLEKCPAVAESNSYATTFDVDLVYKHCTTCGYGVFLSHEDGITKCTFCGVKENYNH